MSEYYTFEQTAKIANNIKTNVEKQYKLGENTQWSYFIAKQIVAPKKDVLHWYIKPAPKSTGDNISRQIVKKDYMDMATRLIKYVDNNKTLPNYITIGNLKMKVNDYTYMFARILAYYNKNKQWPNYANVNSKAFTKPTEYPNKVYGLWVKYIGTKPKYLDDVCDYIKNHFNYQFYYDDQKSNEQVLKTKSGNCTDLLQMLTNMADAMDYDWQVIHTKCRKSGTGHVYGKFRKKGTQNWFIRDIACIADESRYCVWCNVDTGGGYLLAKNPSWFIQNRNR